jgi:hypothetical protein
MFLRVQECVDEVRVWDRVVQMKTPGERGSVEVLQKRIFVEMQSNLKMAYEKNVVR